METNKLETPTHFWDLLCIKLNDAMTTELQEAVEPFAELDAQLTDTVRA